MEKNETGEDIKPLPNEEVINPGGEQDHQDTADDHSERPVKPQEDHSERRGGGDQDIDTAGMVPGEQRDEP